MTDAESKPAVLLENVGKTFPGPRQPHPVVRRLARLGGVELDVGTATEMIGGDDDDDPDDDDDDRRDDFETARPQLSDKSRDTVALEGISLAVPQGSGLAIVGPSRAGKSVLLRIIAGLSPPTSGRAVVIGRVAPAIGAVERMIPTREGPRKALLAVAMMTRLRRRTVRRLLPQIFALAGLDQADTVLGAKLSVQQRLRVVLAMMLLVESDVILVDMPAPVRDQMRDRILERRREGATVIVTAETAAEVLDLVDRIVYLADGRLVDHEAHEPEPGAPAEDGAEDGEERIELRAPAPPLSPDADRYYDFLRVLVGDRRAEEAVGRAAAAFDVGAERLEWVDLAEAAGIDWKKHLAIVERLRRLSGADEDEPIVGAEGRTDLPLSADAERYLEHLRALVGEDRAAEARRGAAELAPEDATRIEWSWIATCAGLDWAQELVVVERLRHVSGADGAEPIFGAQELREKLGRR